MTVSPTATADGTAVGPLFLYWASHACHGPVQVPRATFVGETVILLTLPLHAY